MKSFVILNLLAASALGLAGCRGITAPGENQARVEWRAVTENYRPGNRPPALPQLTPDSSLSNFVAFALLNSPAVETAYYDWSASVENITVSRSLPDPRLSFQAYIVHSLTSLMPGLAWDFPGPGKLKAAAAVAVAGSQDKYFAFHSAALQTAFNLERAYYQLALLDEQLPLKREMLSLLASQAQARQSQNATASAGLADLLRARSDRDRAQTELANLEDSRAASRANFKAALGLTPPEPDPPEPAQIESSHGNLDEGELFRVALAHNPQLKTMEADVRAAQAGIAVAYKDRIPNFNAGLQAEVYAPPFYWPQASMSLPIWRDKLAAEAAQAQASLMQAKSRLKSAQIDLAVNFAEKLFAYHEAGRNVTLIENQLLPEARQSIQSVQASYQAGGLDFSGLTDAEAALVNLKLEAAQARADREIALADLSLIVAGVPPSGAAFLSINAQP